MPGDSSDHSSQQHLIQAEAAAPLDIPAETDGVAAVHPLSSVGRI